MTLSRRTAGTAGDPEAPTAAVANAGSGTRRKTRRVKRTTAATGLQNCVKRRSQQELVVLAVLMLCSNVIVGFVVYWLASPASPITSCPRDLETFANWFSDTHLSPKRKKSFQDFYIEPGRTVTKKFTPVPPKNRKTFWYDREKRSFALARALRSRGWRQVDKPEDAHLIYSYSNHAWQAEDLEPWQRFNYIPDLEKWNEKERFAYYYKQYEDKTGTPPSVYVPESYMLTESEEEIERFRKVLNGPNGRDHPWVHKLSAVNQGKGITILAPQSEPLLTLPDRSLEEFREKDGEFGEKEQSIVQRYICNEMTWNHRKFDVRMYWFVASLDPLIVLYHDGYVRVGNSVYSETTFKDTTSHLTSHTGLGAESKAKFGLFEEELREQYTNHQVKPEFPPGVSTPVEHVRNQFKAALAEMVEIMKDESFVAPALYNQGDDDSPPLTSENGYQFYCADFILDKDLDVWFIEPQNGCGLDEDYYFRLEMHASLFNGMFDILEEVGIKQEINHALLPLKKSGNWEIIYADGQRYHYEGYTRSPHKEGCKVTK